MLARECVKLLLEMKRKSREMKSLRILTTCHAHIVSRKNTKTCLCIHFAKSGVKKSLQIVDRDDQQMAREELAN